MKETNVAGKVPTIAQMAVAELCLNLKDKKLYTRDKDGNIITVGTKVGAGTGAPAGDGESAGDLYWDGTNLLVWNGAAWITVGAVQSVNGQTGAVALDLDDLTDVSLSGVSDKQILVYSDSSKSWSPASASTLSVKVDLTYVAAAAGGTVTNSAGTDAGLPVANGTNAGLMSPGDYNKLAGLPTAVGNGTLNIRVANQATTQTGSYSANQTGASTITIPQLSYNGLADRPTIPTVPSIGNGALTIKTYGHGASGSGSYTSNQASASTITLPQIRYADLSGLPTIPTVPTIGNGGLTIVSYGEGAGATGSFSANQTSASTVTLPRIRYSDLSGQPAIPSVGNGALNIRVSNQANSQSGSFTANQSGATTITIPQIAYSGLSGLPSIPAPANNGTITIVQPGTTNQTFTVNQSGNTTITLRNDNTTYSVYTKTESDGRYYTKSTSDGRYVPMNISSLPTI